MAFQFRRGSNAERTTITPLAGEPLWTTDTNVLYVGDGVTAGGVSVTSGTTGTISNQSLFTNSNVTFYNLRVNNDLDCGTLNAITGVISVAAGDFISLSQGGGVRPYSDLDATLGTASYRWTNLYVNTATISDRAIIGADNQAIFASGFNELGVTNNLNVPNVLSVGSGSGTGYITSKGNYYLELNTSDNDGPGPKIILEHGHGAFITFTDEASRAIANFSTASIILNGNITSDDGILNFGSSATVNGTVTATNLVSTNGITVTNTATLNAITVGAIPAAYTIPGLTTTSGSVIDNATSNGQIWFRTNSAAANRFMVMDQSGNVVFTRNQRISSSPTNGSITISDGTSTTTSLYGGVAIASGAAGSTATTFTVDRAGIGMIYRSQTGTTRLNRSLIQDHTFLNQATVTGAAGFRSIFSQTTQTTAITAMDSSSFTTMSTLTLTNNLLKMTDSTNASVFEFSNTTATFYEPVVATTATVNYQNIANWAVFTAVTADPGGTTATGTVLMADGTQWDPAGFSTTTNYMAFYNGGSWVALG